MLQTKGAVAMFTIEMRMLIVYRTVAIVVANGIFECARTVVDGMYKAVKKEQG